MGADLDAERWKQTMGGFPMKLLERVRLWGLSVLQTEISCLLSARVSARARASLLSDGNKCSRLWKGHDQTSIGDIWHLSLKSFFPCEPSVAHRFVCLTVGRNGGRKWKTYKRISIYLFSTWPYLYHILFFFLSLPDSTHTYTHLHRYPYILYLGPQGTLLWVNLMRQDLVCCCLWKMGSANQR